jgi:type II secretory pathway component PulC
MQKLSGRVLLFAAFTLGISLLISGCGKEEEYSPNPGQSSMVTKLKQPSKENSKAEAVYRYNADRYRDPFVSLASAGGLSRPGEPVVVTINSLVLKGIINDKKQREALISGGGATYVLRNNRLYDTKNAPVHGISGIIKKDSIILIAPDKKSKELFLHSKELQ